jgi:hypothetical protein
MLVQVAVRFAAASAPHSPTWADVADTCGVVSLGPGHP